MDLPRQEMVTLSQCRCEFCIEVSISLSSNIHSLHLVYFETQSIGITQFIFKFQIFSFTVLLNSKNLTKLNSCWLTLCFFLQNYLRLSVCQSTSVWRSPLGPAPSPAPTPSASRRCPRPRWRGWRAGSCWRDTGGPGWRGRWRWTRGEPGAQCQTVRRYVTSVLRQDTLLTHHYRLQ